MLGRRRGDAGVERLSLVEKEIDENLEEVKEVKGGASHLGFLLNIFYFIIQFSFSILVQFLSQQALSKFLFCFRARFKVCSTVSIISVMVFLFVLFCF